MGVYKVEQIATALHAQYSVLGYYTCTHLGTPRLIASGRQCDDPPIPLWAQRDAGDLALGDWISFCEVEELLFEQEVTSMQIEHQNVESATQGDDIGMKVNQPVREGVTVYKRLG